MAIEILPPPALPVVDAQRCTSCGLCAEVCPSQTLVLRQGKLRIEAGAFTGCIGCGQCMMVCPGDHIRVRGAQLRAEHLVDLPPPAERATPGQLDALLLSRRSVRAFAQREVDPAAVRRVLDMTATAPVGIPPSPVGVVVLPDRATVRRFVADTVTEFRRMRRFLNPALLLLTRPFRSSAEHALIRDFVRPLLDLIVSRWDAGEDHLFYDAPAALLFHSAPRSDPADVHIAATYAMLAAQSLGLGSCLIGTMVALNHAPRLKLKYGIPKANQVGLGLILGHPRTTYRRGVRRPFASVLYV